MDYIFEDVIPISKDKKYRLSTRSHLAIVIVQATSQIIAFCQFLQNCSYLAT